MREITKAQKLRPLIILTNYSLDNILCYFRFSEEKLCFELTRVQYIRQGEYIFSI